MKPPIADFNVIPFCQNEPCIFNDLSSDSSNQWFWDFGDSSLSNIQNPQHIYSKAGTYEVQLISSNSFICQDTITKNILIDAPLDPYIGPDTNQCGGSILLNGSVGANVNYTWSDGTVDSILNVSNTGIYWLEINHNGCFERDSVIISIFSPPVSDFRWLGNCVDSSIDFNDYSFSNISSWLWDFGNGDSSNVQNPQHFYSNSGFYNVSLQVLDSNGCIDNYNTIVSIDSTILINLGPDTNQCGGSVHIDGFNGNGIYNWSDGTNNTDITVNTSGTYWLELDNNGCKGRDSINVYIFNLPNADFTWIGGCSDSAILFSDLSSQNIQSWLWDFGDGTNDTVQNPAKPYISDGIYFVNLHVIDSNGCKDNSSDTISIDTVVSGGSYSFSLCYNDVGFNMIEPLPSHIDTSGIWKNSVGDTISNYFHVSIMDTGIYSYEFNTAYPCSITVINTLHVKQYPITSYAINNDTTISIGENLELFCSNGILWSWSPSDQLDCDACQYPIATISDTGYIFINMTDEYNCMYNDSILINLNKGLALHIPTAFTPDGDGYNDHFYISGENICSGEYVIYNRWGNNIFSSNNIFDHWNGTYKAVQQGLEAFTIVGRVEYCDGTEEIFNSKLHLIR